MPYLVICGENICKEYYKIERIYEHEKDAIKLATGLAEDRNMIKKTSEDQYPHFVNNNFFIKVTYYTCF